MPSTKTILWPSVLNGSDGNDRHLKVMTTLSLPNFAMDIKSWRLIVKLYVFSFLLTGSPLRRKSPHHDWWKDDEKSRVNLIKWVWVSRIGEYRLRWMLKGLWGSICICRPSLFRVSNHKWNQCLWHCLARHLWSWNQCEKQLEFCMTKIKHFKINWQFARLLIPG